MSKSLFVSAAVALVAGFGGAAAWSLSGLGDGQVRSYLLENPEMLQEMYDAYQTKQNAQKLSAIADEVVDPFPGAVMGNPNGSITLVEFSDYACTYCRASMPHVQQLIAANPDLKVVVREWPIFQGSEQAARMALAAARQGKFDGFHKAMFDDGATSPAGIMAAAKKSGVDLDEAKEYGMSAEVNAELAQNYEFAQQLGFSGTPSWVIGDRVFEGMVGVGALQEAIDAAKD